MTHSIDQVTTAVTASWNSETSASPELWRPEQPEIGQCVPTSLVLQDYFGGLLARVKATLPDGHSESHYFNTDIPPHGMTLDLTRAQYAPTQEFVLAPIDIEIRDYVLQYEATRRRYDILLGRVTERLVEMSEL